MGDSLHMSQKNNVFTQNNLAKIKGDLNLSHTYTSENGFLRAQTALNGGGAELGDLLETSIGVFQILGKNSDDNFSWGGTLNTSKKHKTAYVNVKQRFEID